MEGYLREKELKTCIWGKESIIVIDEDIEISKNVVVSKLSWIEEHKDEIIEFALASENDFSIDLSTSPDYFGGHLLGIVFNLETNEMEYDGMNG